MNLVSDPILFPNPHAKGEQVNIEPFLRLLAQYDNKTELLVDDIQEALDELPGVLLKEAADLSGYVQAHDLLVKVRRTLK
jgi:hypothetical protein